MSNQRRSEAELSQKSIIQKYSRLLKEIQCKKQQWNHADLDKNNSPILISKQKIKFQEDEQSEFNKENSQRQMNINIQKNIEQPQIKQSSLYPERLNRNEDKYNFQQQIVKRNIEKSQTQFNFQNGLYINKEPNQQTLVLNQLHSDQIMSTQRHVLQNNLKKDDNLDQLFGYSYFKHTQSRSRSNEDFSNKEGQGYEYNSAVKKMRQRNKSQIESRKNIINNQKLGTNQKFQISNDYSQYNTTFLGKRKEETGFYVLEKSQQIYELDQFKQNSQLLQHNCIIDTKYDTNQIIDQANSSQLMENIQLNINCFQYNINNSNIQVNKQDSPSKTKQKQNRYMNKQQQNQTEYENIYNSQSQQLNQSKQNSLQNYKINDSVVLFDAILDKNFKQQLNDEQLYLQNYFNSNSIQKSYQSNQYEEIDIIFPTEKSKNKLDFCQLKQQDICQKNKEEYGLSEVKKQLFWNLQENINLVKVHTKSKKQNLQKQEISDIQNNKISLQYSLTKYDKRHSSDYISHEQQKEKGIY